MAPKEGPSSHLGPLCTHCGAEDSNLDGSATHNPAALCSDSSCSLRLLRACVPDCMPLIQHNAQPVDLHSASITSAPSADMLITP